MSYLFGLSFAVVAALAAMAAALWRKHRRLIEQLWAAQEEQARLLREKELAERNAQIDRETREAVEQIDRRVADTLSAPVTADTINRYFAETKYHGYETKDPGHRCSGAQCADCGSKTKP